MKKIRSFSWHCELIVYIMLNTTAEQCPVEQCEVGDLQPKCVGKSQVFTDNFRQMRICFRAQRELEPENLNIPLMLQVNQIQTGFHLIERIKTNPKSVALPRFLTSCFFLRGSAVQRTPFCNPCVRCTHFPFSYVQKTIRQTSRP